MLKAFLAVAALVISLTGFTLGVDLVGYICLLVAVILAWTLD